MKKLLTTVLVVFLALSVFAKGEKSVQIVQQALVSGNVAKMSTVFDKTIDITFSENNAISYSKKQASALLKKFFAKSTAKNFKLRHQGKSQTNNTLYAIGTLYTKSKNYRVYLFFVPKKDGYYLKEMRFEKL